MERYKAKRILVTGGRDWQDEGIVNKALADHVNILRGDTVVLGGCPTGADAIAEQICRTHGVNIEKYSAQWDAYGRAAGPIRNQSMVDKGADVCLVFDTGGRGTRDCWTRAAHAKIPVMVYTENGNNDIR